MVLAMPFAVLNEIDLSEPASTGSSIRPSPSWAAANGKLHLQFAERGWLGAGPWPGVSNGSSYADTGYQVGWEATRAQPGAARHPGFLLGRIRDRRRVDGSGVRHRRPTGSPSGRGGRASQVAAVYPRLRGTARPPSRFRTRARSSIRRTLFKVGQYTTFGGYEGARQGGVLFCGEHTSIDFQGFMEGAASEGRRAGRQVARMMARD